MLHPCHIGTLALAADQRPWPPLDTWDASPGCLGIRPERSRPSWATCASGLLSLAEELASLAHHVMALAAASHFRFFKSPVHAVFYRATAVCVKRARPPVLDVVWLLMSCCVRLCPVFEVLPVYQCPVGSGQGTPPKLVASRRGAKTAAPAIQSLRLILVPTAKRRQEQLGLQSLHSWQAFPVGFALLAV